MKIKLCALLAIRFLIANNCTRWYGVFKGKPFGETLSIDTTSSAFNRATTYEKEYIYKSDIFDHENELLITEGFSKWSPETPAAIVYKQTWKKNGPEGPTADRALEYCHVA
jgi:hypothetical protein